MRLSGSCKAISTAPEHELPPHEPRIALVRQLTSSLVLALPHKNQ
jgi:hypothetical protein